MNTRDRYKLFVRQIAVQFQPKFVDKSDKLYCPRHAGILASAGFGYPNEHSYLNALKNDAERCVGFYIPDSKMIARCMIEQLGYPESSLDELVRIFVQASTNFEDVGFRADFLDDLQGPPVRIGRSRDRANHVDLMRWIEHAIDDEDRYVRKHFWKYVSDKNPADYFDYDIQAPKEFPSLHHLGRTLKFPIIAVYDLDMRADEEASHYGINRQLAFRGSVLLKPSGRRGWRYPTCRLDDVPFRDERNEAERALEPFVFPGEAVNEDEFEAGRLAAWESKPIPEERLNSLDWLAGYVMRGPNCNASGHMSTGLVDRAFSQAIAYAEALGLFDPLRIAIAGCRQLVSTRSTRQLEAAIAEELDRRQQY